MYYNYNVRRRKGQMRGSYVPTFQCIECQMTAGVSILFQTAWLVYYGLSMSVVR